jgi:hypothetical protein
MLCSVRRLLVTANLVLSSPIRVTLMKEALSSSETSALTRATWRNKQKTPFFIGMSPVTAAQYTSGRTGLSGQGTEGTQGEAVPGAQRREHT